MRGIARIISLTLSLNIFACSAASAECAWVLWVDDSQDSPLGAFSTKEECEKRKEQAASTQKRLGLPARLNCYPDTMDPRPKGWYVVLMTIMDVVEGPHAMTFAILIGGVGAYYGAQRSGRRRWLWFVVGMLVTSVVFGVVSGVVRALSR